jgi:hypothetical protein
LTREALLPLHKDGMLETKFKVALLLIVLAFAALPVMGILRGTTTTPYEDAAPAPDESDLSSHHPRKYRSMTTW